jgi:alpha-L-fucosidase
LTNYGPVFEVWFDGANGGSGYYGGARETRRIDRTTYYEWPKTIELVRKLAPNALVFSDAGPDLRWVGNERGEASRLTWQTIDTEGTYPGLADEKKLATGDPAGKRWVPPETDVSIRPGWFYHASEDSKVKSADELVKIYFESVGRGSNLLLNVPPDRRGLVHENDVKALQGMRATLDALFAKNLALRRPVRASAERGGGGAFGGARAVEFGGARAVDGDPDTYWALDDGAVAGELEVDLGGPAGVKVVRVEEAIALGQRVKRFAVDARVDGAWKTVAEGETLGPRRLFRFDSVKASSVRLRILDALDTPCIAELALY